MLRALEGAKQSLEGPVGRGTGEFTSDPHGMVQKLTGAQPAVSSAGMQSLGDTGRRRRDVGASNLKGRRDRLGSRGV